MQENTPGFFPYTAGIYPLSARARTLRGCSPARADLERTNKRFHYVSQGMPAVTQHRLRQYSTANDPGRRPDIYGKVGNSGVSICYSTMPRSSTAASTLTAPNTSVSMTINGPFPCCLASP
ncbi:MAG: methylmalonyl-CoA mutase family protein [Flavobacteriales bacterium]